MNANESNNNQLNTMRPKILCLHGKSQSGAIFRNKIAGARRKLERTYELHFLDGPILLQDDIPKKNHMDNNDSTSSSDDVPLTYAWWLRNDENGEHLHVREAFHYIQRQTEGKHYDAIIGFSQGGTMATALALTGLIPGIRAVVTAGAPCVDQMFSEATDFTQGNDVIVQSGLDIPKFHMAGETDAMIPVDSTRALSDRGGNGILVLHEQGHLFPTRAAPVKSILDFLETSL